MWDLAFAGLGGAGLGGLGFEHSGRLVLASGCFSANFEFGRPLGVGANECRDL